MTNLSRSPYQFPRKWLSSLALLAAVLVAPAILADESKSTAGACCTASKPESKDCAASASTCAAACSAETATFASLSAKWGIEVASLRLSAGGNMLDFRYKVLDSEKAAPISHVEWKPYLIDEKTGAKMVVPRMPKIGSLRQTAVKPVVGRQYTMLFVNPGQTVKSGSKVTIVIGECRIENLTVQ